MIRNPNKNSIGQRLLNTAKSQPLIILFLIFIVTMAVIKPSFTSLSNLNNVLVDASIYGVSALAMTIAIIGGEFDLSLAANFAWAQLFFCFLLNRWGGNLIGIIMSFITMILSTMLIGAVNGLIVVKGKVSSFIVTLSMATIVKGLCLIFTGGDMISTNNEFIKTIGKSQFLGISALTYTFILFIIIAYYVMKYTQFGRNIYATGGNYEVAKLSGINVAFSKISVFVILGLAAGISGAMFVCLMRAGSVLYGTDLSLTCVAATVIGGTPLTGGKGKVIRTVIGILIIYVIYKALAFLGLQGYYNTLIRGLVLLTVVAVDSYMNRLERA